MADWEQRILDSGLNHIRKESQRVSVFMVTYFPTLSDFSRDTFGDGILDFMNQTKRRVLSYILAAELTTEGKRHYHMALKLGSKINVTTLIKELTQRKIRCDVSTNRQHFDDYVKYLYVPSATKTLDVMDADPRINNYKVCKTWDNERNRPKRITVRGFFGLVAKYNIQSEDDVLRVMQDQAQSKQFGLSEFYMKHRMEIDGYITIGRRIMQLPMAERDTRDRIAVMRDASLLDCSCDNEYVPGLQWILRANGISESVFTESILKALKTGSKKYTNIQICGPSNCGKTTLIVSLLEIFGLSAFIKPSAATTMPLLNILDKKIAIFNDYRWSKQSKIDWSDLLNLVEGRELLIGMPKNLGVKDIHYKCELPFVVTGCHYYIFHYYIISDRKCF